MERLPIDRWKIQFTDTGILVAAHCNGPDGRDLYWTKFKLSDFPKDVIGIDDFKRAVFETVDASPIPQDVAALSLKALSVEKDDRRKLDDCVGSGAIRSNLIGS